MEKDFMRDKKEFDLQKFDHTLHRKEQRLNVFYEPGRYWPLVEHLIRVYVRGHLFDGIKKMFAECLEYGLVYKGTQENYPNHEYFIKEVWVLLAFGFGLNIKNSQWDTLALELLTPAGDEWLMDTIIAQKYPDRKIGVLEPWGKTPTGKRFNHLYGYIQSKGDSQFAKKHLKKWHSNANGGHFRRMVGFGVLASDPNVENERYIGLFAFELAATVMAFDFDDSDFCEDIYYPKELVEYWRENK